MTTLPTIPTVPHPSPAPLRYTVHRYGGPATGPAPATAPFLRLAGDTDDDLSLEPHICRSID